MIKEIVVLLMIGLVGLTAFPPNAAADQADCSERALDAHAHEGAFGLPTANPAVCYNGDAATGEVIETGISGSYGDSGADASAGAIALSWDGEV